MAKLVVAAVLLLAPFWAQPGPAPAAKGVDLVRMWLDLARQHAPGDVDDSVRRLRLLTFAELAEVQSGLEALIEFLKQPGLTRLRQSRRPYTDREQALLKDLAVAEAARGTANALMRQIALLHADAMTLRGAVTFVADTTARGAASDLPVVSLVSDGVAMGGALMPPLWPIARAAIDGIQPRASTDAWARQWYQATTSYLFYSFQLAALPAHLEARRASMPDDVRAVFDTGCLYEAFAGSRVQATVRSERARGISLAVPGVEEALARARREFDDVLARDPLHVEARLRRARVQAQSGDARRAATELAGIAGTKGADRELRYLASMFLGDVHWSLGDAAAAADAYDSALALYPRAQSPAVGLLLARPRARESDTARIEAVLRSAPTDRLDPWFDYHLGPGRRASAQLDLLWNAFIAR